MASQFQAKCTILTMIRDNKELLFGKFSNTVSHAVKEEKWEEILSSAIAMNLVGSDKKCSDLRNVTWQNWRRSTMVSNDYIKMMLY